MKSSVGGRRTEGLFTYAEHFLKGGWTGNWGFWTFARKGVDREMRILDICKGTSGQGTGVSGHLLKNEWSGIRGFCTFAKEWVDRKQRFLDIC